MRRFINAQTLILVSSSLFVIYLTAVPLAMLLFGSVRTAPLGEPGAAYTIQNYINAYVDRDFYVLFWNSLKFAIGTCVVSFLIGTYLQGSMLRP